MFANGKHVKSQPRWEMIGAIDQATGRRPWDARARGGTSLWRPVILPIVALTAAFTTS